MTTFKTEAGPRRPYRALVRGWFVRRRFLVPGIPPIGMGMGMPMGVSGQHTQALKAPAHAANAEPAKRHSIIGTIDFLLLARCKCQ